MRRLAPDTYHVDEQLHVSIGQRAYDRLFLQSIKPFSRVGPAFMKVSCHLSCREDGIRYIPWRRCHAKVRSRRLSSSHKGASTFHWGERSILSIILGRRISVNRRLKSGRFTGTYLSMDFVNVIRSASSFRYSTSEYFVRNPSTVYC